MACEIRIDSVAPSTVCREVPFKVECVLTIDADDPRNDVAVSFLTDDARVWLCDAASDDSPATVRIPVQPGNTVRRTASVYLKLRKGLVDEFSRDGTSAEVALHARVLADDGTVDAVSFGFPIEVENLAKRLSTKFFR